MIQILTFLLGFNTCLFVIVFFTLLHLKKSKTAQLKPKKRMKYNEDFNIGLWVLIFICLISSLALLRIHTELPNYIVWLSLFYLGINVFWEMFK